MESINKETIPLKMEKPTSSEEIAKFIISNTYYLLLNYLNEKIFKKIGYSEFLNKFKKIFIKENLEDKFTFELLAIFDKSDRLGFSGIVTFSGFVDTVFSKVSPIEEDKLADSGCTVKGWNIRGLYWLFSGGNAENGLNIYLLTLLK